VEPDLPERRRLRRWIIIAVILLLALCGAELGISKFLDYKLRDTISDRLDAQLTIEGLWYVPPLSVHISGATLHREEERLLSIGPSEIKLAQIPLPGRPVVIDSVAVDQPIVELTRDKDGFIGGPGFVKERAHKTHRPPKKLSEMLRLRHFQLSGGRVTYTDQRAAKPLPMTWGDINIDIALARKSAENYGFKLGAQTAQAAELKLTGAINVDTFVLEVVDLALKLNAEPVNDQSPLPEPIQRAIQKFEINGKVVLSGRAILPLQNPQDSEYSALISLDEGKARLPDAGFALDRASAKIQVEQVKGPLAANVISTATTQPVTTQTIAATHPAATTTTAPAPADHAIIVTVKSFDGFAAGTRVTVDRGQLVLDPRSNHWTLGDMSGHLKMRRTTRPPDPTRQRLFARYAPEGHIDFTVTGQGPIHSTPSALKTSTEYHVLAYPQESSIQLPNFPQRIEAIGGSIRFENDVISIENLAAKYGHDEFRIRTARLPLEGLRKQTRIDEIAAVAQINDPAVEYSPAVMKYLTVARPSGNYAVAGWIHVDRTQPTTRSTYNLQISSDQGGLVLSKSKLPLKNIHTDIFATSERIRIPTFEANTLDGRLIGNADVRIADTSTYEGQYNLRDGRLEHLEEVREALGQKPQHISGSLFTNGTFSGSFRKGEPPLAGLKGNGTLEVIRGDFFRLPVLSKLLTSARVGQSIGTVGELATAYAIDNQAINLTNCAINSPLVGIQGSGKITFTGDLDLTAIVAPLADWRDKMRETKIPFVSNVVGEVVGNVQKLLNSATKNLLYQFRIDGKISDPRVRPIPAPVLTNTAAFVFGRMVQGVRDGELLGTVRSAAEPAPTN
jgi:hypothetical protein